MNIQLLLIPKPHQIFEIYLVNVHCVLYFLFECGNVLLKYQHSINPTTTTTQLSYHIYMIVLKYFSIYPHIQESVKFVRINPILDKRHLSKTSALTSL